MTMTFYAITAIVVMAVAFICVVWWRHLRNFSPAWAGINAVIAHDFPNVPRITVHGLTEWLNDPSRLQPLLLDVRSRNEYEVSHLRNARWIDAGASLRQAMAGVPRTQPIVTYCAVGYRSSEYSLRLIRDGFTNVQDLRGSIFEWVNDGWPVYRDGRAVREVHPYNGYWGQLLKRSLWASHLAQRPQRHDPGTRCLHFLQTADEASPRGFEEMQEACRLDSICCGWIAVKQNSAEGRLDEFIKPGDR